MLDRLLEEDKFEGKDGRQAAIVDWQGNIAAYTGANAPNWAGDRQGKNWSAQGNILAGPRVVESMGRAFEATPGELAEKLYAALQAGDEAGGDARGKQWASMLVVRKQGGRNINNDRAIYINVDDHPQPLAELRRLLDLNLGYLYRDRSGKFPDAGQTREARQAAEKAVRYWPQRADAHLNLGLLDYAMNDKAGALGELSQARSLINNPSFRGQFRNGRAPSGVSGYPERQGISEAVAGRIADLAETQEVRSKSRRAQAGARTRGFRPGAEDHPAQVPAQTEAQAAARRRRGVTRAGTAQEGLPPGVKAI